MGHDIVHVCIICIILYLFCYKLETNLGHMQNLTIFQILHIFSGKYTCAWTPNTVPYNLCAHTFVPLKRCVAGLGQETWLKHCTMTGGLGEPPVPKSRTRQV